MPWISPDEDIENENEATQSAFKPETYPISQSSYELSSSGNGNLASFLSRLEPAFKKLSCIEKNQALDYLIDACGGPQLYHLSKRLNVLLRRDFIRLLPNDVIFHLLQYVDVKTLKTCCLVSKRWNVVVNNCYKSWKSAARLEGVNVDDGQVRKASDYKRLYMIASTHLAKLRHGTALRTTVFYGHRDRIMTVYYQDGVIATGSDDHTIRLWNCASGICFRLFRTSNTVAAVKFDNSRIVTASFNTTAHLWSLETGEKLVTYSGHVAAVFCLDFDAKMDLLVTGSADSTVKIWILSSGAMIKSLPHHRSAWKTHVCLYWSPEQDYYSILSRDSTVIHAWRLNRSHEVISASELDMSGAYLLPGWQVTGKFVSYATTSYTNGGKCKILQVNLHDREIQSSEIVSFQPEYEPQTFLGSGNQFIVLLQAENGERSLISVYLRSNGRLVANVPMPPDYRPSKRSSTFTLGERRWLDGLTDTMGLGVFLITSLRDNGIVQLCWKDQEC